MGVELNHSVGSPGRMHFPASSPDGRTVVTSGEDGSAAILWDVETGAPIQRFSGAEPAYAAAFSPDGRRIVAGFFDGTAILWDIETRKSIRQFPHGDFVG